MLVGVIIKLHEHSLKEDLTEGIRNEKGEFNIKNGDANLIGR